ncbi:uncharacterized protein LOC107627558 [Arachis ipaensis]|uniref:uncharacterized protein LOC107627558 n=1 Tax=Arachis ipaensis TaxID=130454 RepID=UPI0007AFC7B0|nr:uncharacterized protein LOC107627558 [Arachis ipaensis]
MRGGPRGLSDHCPIIVEERGRSDGPRPFRSLYSWFTHEGFLRMVKEEWRGLGEAQFTDKLKALIGSLGRWHKDNFGEMDKKIMKFEEEIKKIDDKVGGGVYDGTMEARRRALVTFCEKWYVRKELHWKQMSRSRHAKDIDKNTRYFHNLASARRRNNRIDVLLINGRLIRNQARIKIAIRDFYKSLYHQEESPLIGFRDGLVERISEDDALALEVQPNPEEIKEAVWDCESCKAPGSDGYNMNFIKRCWAEIGSDFTAAVTDFFLTSKLPADANLTWVALAPKFIGAKEIKDLRPIKKRLLNNEMFFRCLSSVICKGSSPESCNSIKDLQFPILEDIEPDNRLLERRRKERWAPATTTAAYFPLRLYALVAAYAIVAIAAAYAIATALKSLLAAISPVSLKYSTDYYQMILGHPL